MIIPDLDTTLCLFLAGSASEYASGDTPNTCKRDPTGKIVFQGDWCSSTNSAATAGCADAFVLSASYAASAVEIPERCAP